MQNFAQQGKGDRSPLFQRVAVERVQQGGQAAHVAWRAAAQIGEGARRQAESAAGGLSCQGGVLFSFGQRLEPVNKPGAKAGAQVFAHGELLRRRGGGGEQTPG